MNALKVIIFFSFPFFKSLMNNVILHFRRSCTRILENKVAPILASLIGFLDTNFNLDLMDMSQCSWKWDLWLAILHSAEALGLQV